MASTKRGSKPKAKPRPRPRAAAAKSSRKLKAGSKPKPGAKLKASSKPKPRAKLGATRRPVAGKRSAKPLPRSAVRPRAGTKGKPAPKRPGKPNASKPLSAKIPSWRSPHYGLVSPYLHVQNVRRALDWYERAFGFRTRLAIRGPADSIVHAEMAHQDVVFIVGPPDPEHGGRDARSLGGSSTASYVFVPDVDAVWRHATELGATSLQAPRDEFWGDRTCLLVDPELHRWAFATHVRDVPPEELAAAATSGH